MRVATARFGELEVSKEDIITFPRGILGFEDFRQYILIHPDEKSPFSYLQSIEDPDLTFVVVDPTAFWPDYEVRVSQEEVQELAIEDPEQVAVVSIVTIPPDPKKMTANLQGPVLVNVKNRRGKQVVLSDEKYTTKHRLFPDVEQSQTA